MAIPLVGSPPPPTNYGDLITGNSSNFKTGVGNWTTPSGGTLTYDSTIAYMWPSNNTGSAKWVSTASGGLSYSFPATQVFRSGIEYSALMVMTVEEDVEVDFFLRFGVNGTDDVTYTYPGFGPLESVNGGRHQAFLLRWRPNANRTGVTLTMWRTTGVGPTLSFHLCYVKVARSELSNAGDLLLVGHPETNAAGPRSGYALVVDNSTQGVRLSTGSKFNGGLTIRQWGSTSIESHTGGSGIYARDAMSGVYVDSNAADLAAEGFNIEAGPDAVGITINEKDANTVQIYPDQPSGYDVELVDRGTRTWRNRAADNGIAIPSKGMLPSYASDPSSPAERQMYWNSTTKQIRVHNGTGWQDVASGTIIPINWLGAWSSATAYVEGDGVDHDGASYVATASTTNDEPPASPWQLIAAAGVAGADGADGEGVPTGGTTGQILAKNTNTDFDTEWVDAPTGGGGGPDISGTISVIKNECFLNASTDVYEGAIKVNNILGNTANFGNETGHPGIISSTTGSSSTGSAGLSTTTSYTQTGDAKISFGCIVKIPTLSDGSQRFKCLFGLGLSQSTLNSDEVVAFTYSDNEVSGNWGLTIRHFAVGTTLADSGVAVNTGWNRLEFVLEEDCSEVNFFVNGTLVHTATSNIPPAGTAIRLIPFTINKSVGTTARELRCDAYWYVYEWATSR